MEDALSKTERLLKEAVLLIRSLKDNCVCIMGCDCKDHTCPINKAADFIAKMKAIHY